MGPVCMYVGEWIVFSVVCCAVLVCLGEISRWVR